MSLITKEDQEAIEKALQPIKDFCIVANVELTKMIKDIKQTGDLPKVNNNSHLN